MSQLLLPFQRFRVSAADVQCLQLANAASYARRKYWFYPFKSAFLAAHGLPDGFDVQILTLRCWCGDGIWRGYYDTVPRRYWETCYRCNGTGIYDIKRVKLHRWLLGDRLFHEPNGLVTEAEVPAAREVITGRIQHSFVSSTDGERAFAALLWRHDRPQFWMLMRAWRQELIARLKQAWRRFVWLCRIDDFEDDYEDIPF